MNKLQLKKYFSDKYNNIDEQLFDLSYNASVKSGMSDDDILEHINHFELKKVYLKSNTLLTLLFKILIHSPQEELIKNNYLFDINQPKVKFPVYAIKYQNLLKDKLLSDDFAFQTALHTIGFYDWAKEPYDFSKSIIDFNTLVYLKDQHQLNIVDLLDKNIILDEHQQPVYMKNVLVNQVKENNKTKNYLILQSRIDKVNEQSGYQYFLKWKLLDGVITKSLLPNHQIDGICLVNNYMNMKFDVINYDFDQLQLLWYNKINKEYEPVFEDQIKWLFTQECQTMINNFYTKVNQYLLQMNVLDHDIINNNQTKIDFADKVKLLSKDNQSTNLDHTTSFKPNSPIRYYDEFGNDELTPDQKTYKFYKSIYLSPSQLNSILYCPNVKLAKDVFMANFDDYFQLILNKYNLEQTPDGNYVKKVWDESALTRMNFGNYIELDIVRTFANQFPEFNTHTDKRTLTNDLMYFDIDGYIGKDLNNVYQVLEVKNTASYANWQDPNNLVKSYWIQATMYTKLLHSKNGVLFLGCISNKSQSKFVQVPFVPTQEQKDTVDYLQYQYLKTLHEVVNNPLYEPLVNVINQQITHALHKVLPQAPDYDLKTLVNNHLPTLTPVKNPNEFSLNYLK